MEGKMERLDFFGMRTNAEERRMIERLAERLQRTRSDAIRFVIRETLRALDSDPAGRSDQEREDCPCPN
jgi:uncharacterized protein (UPF0261 family)